MVGGDSPCCVWGLARECMCGNRQDVELIHVFPDFGYIADHVLPSVSEVSSK